MTAPAFICKLCHDTEVARCYTLQRETKNVTPFTVATCAGCGLFQDVYDWREAARAQEPLKGHLSDRFDPQWESEPELLSSRAKARAFAQALDEVGMVRGKRILDIGSGYGIFLDECRSLGAASVTGLEFFGGRAIEHARRELGIDDMRSVPIEDRSAWPDAEFDAVCSLDVVEHIHDLRSFFDECLRIVKPGGMFLHATPGSDSLSNRIGRVAVGPLGRVHRARIIGTSLCNLQPDTNRRGGAHVSLLGKSAVEWLVSHYGLTLIELYYTSSYTYTNRHYANLVPPLNRLPLPVGAAIFGIVRRVVRNKLVLLARSPPVGSLSPWCEAGRTAGSRP